LEVRPDALAETQLTAESLEPADGQALLRVLRFGCTANNVTYALLGDTLGFGRFFPASVGWTRVPAWGVAEVVATRTDAVREGERFFGFCPMAAEMVLTPRAAPFGVVDVAEHRASLMPAYNAYRHPDAEGQAEQILLRPLFLLAFLLDEDLVARDAGGVLLSSASSKTASAIAFLVASRGCHVIGLTSPATSSSYATSASTTRWWRTTRSTRCRGGRSLSSTSPATSGCANACTSISATI